MKCAVKICCALLLLCRSGHAQGFVNLDFESANVSGYSPGSLNVPTSAAFPGWNGYFVTSTTTNQATHVWFDAISFGASAISLNDTNNGLGPIVPFQGKYSAYLYGGSGNVSAMITQTGMAPIGTESILMEVSQFFGFVVTLDGQPVTMVPLQTFSNYTVYGGNIPAYSGQLVQLAITAPPTSSPNIVILDDIFFSPNIVPEPSGFALGTLGALLLGFHRRRNSSR